MPDAAGFLLVFAATAALTPVLMQRAQQWRLVALPSDRKLHSGAIPVVGGLAMGLAFLAAYLAQGALSEAGNSLAVAGAIAVALLGGVLDDRHELSAALKFSFQIVAAALLVLWGGALLTHVGNLMSAQLFTLGRWSLPLSLFAIVGVMNAINMSDGLDGLAGGFALAACLGFGFAALMAGDAIIFTAICLAAGAVAGFLVHNARLLGRGTAPVYMGDTGSMLLGLLLAWFAIRLAMSERPALAPISAVWVLALPIGDTVTLMIRRAIRRKNPFTGDREHLHHILLALGLSSGKTVLILIGTAALISIAGLTAERTGVPERVMFYLFVVGMLAYGVAAEILCRRLLLRQPAR